jgi:peptidoglycan glycosyltransferase
VVHLGPLARPLRGLWPALSVALGLGLLTPRAGHGAADTPPPVLLESLHVASDGVTAPIAGGGTARLTLDPALERAATLLLARAHARTSAVTAIDVRTGRLLAWAGGRGGDPAHGVVVDTLAPAASLFKIVTTTALLEKHVNPGRTVCVSGGTSSLSLENLVRPRAGHALCAPFREALGRSRNAVFAQLATRFLSREDLALAADRFGFGRNAPFDVPAPVGNLEMPEGDLAFGRAAAGFVGSRLSPLGAAYLATTVASGGRAVRLRVVESADGYRAPNHRETLAQVMREPTARELVRMMEVTIHSGTSREIFTDPDGHSYLGDVRAAGKTGTLQEDGAGPTTSWFIGFAPSRAPRVVVSVLLENGAGWREKANEVGRDLLRSYFAARGYRGVTVPEGL